MILYPQTFPYIFIRIPRRSMLKSRFRVYIIIILCSKTVCYILREIANNSSTANFFSFFLTNVFVTMRVQCVFVRFVFLKFDSTVFKSRRFVFSTHLTSHVFPARANYIRANFSFDNVYKTELYSHNTVNFR